MDDDPPSPAPSSSPARPRRGGRSGFTTGACAAAAARAAALGVIQGRIPESVETLLPNGQTVIFAVAESTRSEAWSEAVVIKDAGDDPDCTHGARMTARVRPLPGAAGEIRLEGGEGVGRVTRPGLGLPVGLAAINPVPRSNIADNLRAAAGAWLDAHGLEATLSIPGGEALARKTLNPRLGIVGGLSILGTSGIVHPYSTAAYKAAVRQSIEAAAALGVETLVLTTGRRTERFAMARLPELPEYCFIQMGDFIGAALASVAAAVIPRVVVAAMPGKLAKIGQGLDNTHARKGAVDLAAVAEAASRAGGGEETVRQAGEGVTVRHAVDLLAEQGLREAFAAELAQRALAAVKKRLPPSLHVEIWAFDFEGTLLASLTEWDHG
ncbi:MAG: cobalt-precorrin-5B (C(1))-methyltransferase [Magnetococcales bacterium]|nr:cobalt-precorrin-5B (C(1))-methyltransferase [Magnetococcales bacterium]